MYARIFCTVEVSIHTTRRWAPTPSCLSSTRIIHYHIHMNVVHTRKRTLSPTQDDCCCGTTFVGLMSALTSPASMMRCTQVSYIAKNKILYVRTCVNKYICRYEHTVAVLVIYVQVVVYAMSTKSAILVGILVYRVPGILFVISLLLQIRCHIWDLGSLKDKNAAQLVTFRLSQILCT